MRRSRGRTRPSRAWRSPSAAQPEPRAPVVPHAWRLGERARSRSGGWEGRVAAIEKGGSRATLEAGGMRVSVSVDDLELAVGNASAGSAEGGHPGGRGRVRPGPDAGRRSAPMPAPGISSLMLTRARTVASSLDLRGARVDEALDALGRYLDDASLAGPGAGR